MTQVSTLEPSHDTPAPTVESVLASMLSEARKQAAPGTAMLETVIWRLTEEGLIRPGNQA